MKKTVVVGMSGGVDSSVATLLLKQQGYNVIGLFMRNWHEEDENGACTAEADYTDVRRVAALLDIPYYTIDLSKEYYDRVFKLFLHEYERGRTPNPDVLCNREIKFGPFKEFAAKLGADYIATGHYCGVRTLDDGTPVLYRAADENKDQTYFLNQVYADQLQNVLFPLTELQKPDVRKIALENGLSTAEKKDSTGICFIGERNFRAFLKQYLPMKDGDIKTLDGRTIGTHNGVFYYTLGQRKGLGLGGTEGGNGQPYYVVSKDVKNNILYVSQGEGEELFRTELDTEPFHLISRPLPADMRVQARLRHRQPLAWATASYNSDGGIHLVFDEPMRAVTSGQYAVLYDGRDCLGGGVII